MPRSPELGGPPAEQQTTSLKEALNLTPIEGICKGVDVVETKVGERKYRVTWEKGEAPVCSFFDNLQQVLNQHERVIERYLGTQIPLLAGGLLRIEGETQRMGIIAGRLSSLGGKYLMPLSLQDSAGLKREIGEIVEQIGKVTNEYKVKAKEKLRSAVTAPKAEAMVDGILQANISILERNKQCLEITQGTLIRFRIVAQTREEWEGLIEKYFYRLAARLKGLSGEVDDKERQQMGNEVSGEQEGILAHLNRISGPEYWQRIQSREVQNLGRFRYFLSQGEDERARRILREAILKLERVVKEKQERAKNQPAKKNHGQ